MLIKESFIYFKDNSGCKKVKIFFKGKKKYISKLGVIKGSVKKAVSSGNGNQNDQKSNIKGSKKLRIVEEHSKVKVLIISTKKEKSRKNGTYIRFPECRGLVINDEKKIAKTIATTISGIYPKELKKDRRYKVFTKREKSERSSQKMGNIQREEGPKELAHAPLKSINDGAEAPSSNRSNLASLAQPTEGGKGIKDGALAPMISLRELIHREALQPWEKTTKFFLPI